MTSAPSRSAAPLPAGPALAGLLAGLLAVPAAAAPPELALRVAGPPEIVLAAEEMTCVGIIAEEGIDVTDVPVTAFRRPDGTVLVLSGNSNGFFMSGPSVEAARRQGCERILGSERNPDPRLFRDKEWVLALYATDSRTVYGFVHNEYHGEQHGETGCRLRPSNERECWYAAVTWVKSTDGGRTFNRPEAPGNLVLTVPFEYRPKMRRAGVGMPKLVRRGDWLWMLASYHNRAVPGAGGQCLLRAPAARPERWEVWTGRGFAPVPGTPYAFEDDRRADPCGVVFRGNLLSFKQVRGTDLFLALTMDRENVYYVTSRNLVDWSDERLLFSRASALVDFEVGDYDVDSLPKYFSLLDPASDSPGFDTVSDRFYVYYVQYHARDGRRLNSRRDVYRIPVALE